MMVDIYTKEKCGYCTRAKSLLQEKGLIYNEHKLGEDFTREFILENFPRAKTFPVIVIDGMNIGGYDNLASHLNIVQDLASNLKYLIEG